MLKKVKIALALTMGISIGSSYYVVNAATGAGHTFGAGSVDDKEIRWGSSTSQTTYRDYAITTWNALKTIKIAPDTITTYEDLTFLDVNRPDEDYNAQWVSYVGADEIQINSPNFNASGRTDAQKKKTVTHEVGHAFGLDDHTSSVYSGIIMYGSASSVTSLQAHDKEDYNSNWN